MNRSAWLAAVMLGVPILFAGAGGRAAANDLDNISIPELRDKLIHKIENVGEKKPGERSPAEKGPERKSDYERRIERRLDWIDGRIHQLEIDAKRQGSDSKSRLDRELPDLRAQRREAEDQLEKLGAAGGEKWRDLQGGVDSAVHRVEETLDRIGSKI